MAEYYLWIKSFHLIAVISWMIGLLYLPRLFAYHADAAKGSELDLTFQKMERRLLRIIMNPAMILTYILGFLLASVYGLKSIGVWFHIKFALVIILTVFHMVMAKWRKDFIAGSNNKTSKFFRIINEIPAIIMAFIVILVIVKPFE
jgi:putative membrane protein